MLRRVYPLTALRIRGMHCDATTVVTIASSHRTLSVGWTGDVVSGGGTTKSAPFAAAAAPAVAAKPQDQLQQQARTADSLRDAQIAKVKEEIAAAAAKEHDAASKRYAAAAPEPVPLRTDDTAMAWSHSPFPVAPVKMADELRRNLFVEAPRNTGIKHEEEMEWETDLTGRTVHIRRLRGQTKLKRHAAARNRVKKTSMTMKKSKKAVAASAKKARRFAKRKKQLDTGCSWTPRKLKKQAKSETIKREEETLKDPMAIRPSTMISPLGSDAKMAAQRLKAKQAMASESKMSEAASHAIAETLPEWSATHMAAGEASKARHHAAGHHPAKADQAPPELDAGANFERVEWRFDPTSRTWQKWHQDLFTAKWRLVTHTKSTQQKL